ncbi:WhiB family transcription factor [Gordonia phage Marietta]|uniref:WhiB family transcription factor n=1 Tax=Gordonia phage Marietta TaxID=2301558 RepID=A0A385DS91_9CAUD|nr:transcriptional regulator WhiB-like [Gordonia phage Marietta]AXQ61375.1 WhiB family transcription factor [Gordonia phage Marietta]QAU06381.1 WhiB family transcription factor [Gordonia phage WhoseManz]
MIPLSLISPAQRAVDRHEALCCQERFMGSWLWDAELDGGGKKNAKGESAVARRNRHEGAKYVCRACSQREVCLAAALTDPLAEGIYGGELIMNRTQEAPPDGLRQDSGESRFPA